MIHFLMFYSFAERHALIIRMLDFFNFRNIRSQSSDLRCGVSAGQNDFQSFRFMLQKVQNLFPFNHITIISRKHLIKYHHATAIFRCQRHSLIKLPRIDFASFCLFFLGKSPGKTKGFFCRHDIQSG